MSADYRVEDVDDALGKLADVAWWMKGFAAARPPSIDEGSGEHRALEAYAGALRVWIVGLVRGTKRRIAFNDDERILISLPEFEAMRDGLQPLTDDDARNADILSDRERAFCVSCRILSQYRLEEREANDDSLPF